MSKTESKAEREMLELLSQFCISGMDDLTVSDLKEIVKEGKRALAYIEKLIEDYTWQLEVGKRVQAAAKETLKRKKALASQT